VPQRFKDWTAEQYPDRRDDIMQWRTWDQVPDYFRHEWWEPAPTDMNSNGLSVEEK
jgi:hypothetical protein